MSVCVCSVFVLFICVGNGLATAWFPVQGVLSIRASEEISYFRPQDHYDQLYCHTRVYFGTQIDVGFEVVTAVVMKSTVFWDIMACSPLKVNRRFGGHIASIFRVEKYTERGTILKQCGKQYYYVATSVDFQRTTRCYIPEHGTLQKLKVFLKTMLVRRSERLI
jgi:hypothetical protein